MAYIQARYEVELQTAEKQLEEEQLATRERIDHEINDKIFQLQEELVATELNEGMYPPRYHLTMDTSITVISHVPTLLAFFLSLKNI